MGTQTREENKKKLREIMGSSTKRNSSALKPSKNSDTPAQISQRAENLSKLYEITGNPEYAKKYNQEIAKKSANMQNDYTAPSPKRTVSPAVQKIVNDAKKPLPLPGQNTGKAATFTPLPVFKNNNANEFVHLSEKPMVNFDMNNTEKYGFKVDDNGKLRRAWESEEINPQKYGFDVSATGKIVPVSESTKKRSSKEIENDIQNLRREMATAKNERTAQSIKRSTIGRLLDDNMQIADDGRAQADVDRRIAELNTKKKELDKELLTVKKAEYKALSNNYDFDKLSKPITDKSGLPREYKYINDIDGYRKKERDNANDSRSAGIFIYDRLSPEEIQTYNYIFATSGKEKADDYLEVMLEELNARQGAMYASDYAHSNTAEKILRGATIGVGSGIENTLMGLKQVLSEEAVPTTANQYAASEIRPEMSKAGRFFFDAGELIGGQLPNIVAAPFIGGGAASTLLGLSAGGNAYKEKIEEGYSPEEARGYATVIGLLEGALQYAIGGITSMGRKPSSKSVTEMANAIRSAVLRLPVKLTISGGKEASEEMLQDFLVPVVETLMLGEEYEPAKLEDMLYTGLLAFATNGIFNAGDIVSDVSNHRAGNQIIKDGKTDALIDSGLKSGTESETYKLAEQLRNRQEKGKKISPYQLGELKRQTEFATAQEEASPEEVQTPKPKMGSNGQRGFAETYVGDTVETVAPKDATAGYKAVYNSTIENRAMTEAEAQAAAKIPDTMVRAAESAARADAVAETSPQVYNENTNEQEDMNDGREGVHLRGSSQRADGSYTQGQIPAVEEDTRRDSSGDVQTFTQTEETDGAYAGEAPLTYGRKKLTSADIVGRDIGSRHDRGIRLVTDGETADTRAARKVAEENGLELVLFSGDNLHITDKHGNDMSARAYIRGKKMYIRADHPVYTAEQLAKHEAGHDRIDRGEIDVDAVRKKLAGRTDEASRLYIEAYLSENEMTVDEIWAEVICDSLAGMNIFAQTDSAGVADAFLADVRQATSETARESKQTMERSIPDGHASRDLTGKTFPPFDVSHSMANTEATRWAHREDVIAGDRSLISYHGNMYLIEKFDSDDLLYRIVKKFTAKEYAGYIEEYRRYSDVKEAGLETPVEKRVDRDSSLDRGSDIDNGAEHSSGTLSLGNGSGDTKVSKVGKNENSGRKVHGKRDGSNKDGSADTQDNGHASRELDNLELLRRENEDLKLKLHEARRQVKRTERPTARLGDAYRAAQKLKARYDVDMEKEDLGKKLHELANDMLQNGELSYEQIKKRATKIAAEMADNAIARDTSEKLDDLGVVYENPYSYNRAQAVEYIANDIVDIMLSEEIRRDAPTFADKQAEKHEKELARQRRMREDIRKNKNERIEKLKEEAVERVIHAIDVERKKQAEEVRKIESDYRKKGSLTDIRRGINRRVRRLGKKLVKPTKTQHIPEELRKLTAELLSAINLESVYELTYDPITGKERRAVTKDEMSFPTKRTETARELRKLYETIADGKSGTIVSDDLVIGRIKELEELRAVPIGEMTREELGIVWDALTAVEESISTANEILSESRYKTVERFAEGIREDNRGKNRFLKGKLNKAAFEMLTPEAFFHRLGPAGDAIFKMLVAARDKNTRILSEAVDWVQRELGDMDVNGMRKEMHDVTFKGKTYQMSTLQLMSLRNLWQREKAKEHILYGGIVVGKNRKNAEESLTIRRPSKFEIEQAINQLTPKQKAYADKMMRFLSENMADYGNQATMDVYGFKIYNEPNYWTIETTESKAKKLESSGEKNRTIASRAFSNPTMDKVSSALLVEDAVDVFTEHISGMAQYAAWLATEQDIKRIRNFRFIDENGKTTETVDDVIREALGGAGAEYLDTLINDLAGGTQNNEGFAEGAAKAMMGANMATAIAGNVRVVIQQPTALVRAADMISPKYLLMGMKPAEGFKKAMKYAPIAKWKSWGYFEANVGKPIQEVMFNTQNAVDKVNDAAMWGVSKADSLAWGALWNACEAETQHRHKELMVGSERYYAKVAERFTEIIDHTQVVDGTLQRAQVMRNKSTFAKMATAFMSEPLKQVNMLTSAVYDLKHAGTQEERSKAKRRLLRTTTSLAMSALLNSAAVALVDAARDDDDEKKYWERWLKHFVGVGGDGAKDVMGSAVADAANPLNYMPVLKDFWSLVRGYDVSRMDMGVAESILGSAGQLIKAMSGDGKQTVGMAVTQFIADAARVFKIPASNLLRDVRSLVNVAVGASDSYVLRYHVDRAQYNPANASNSAIYLDNLYKAYKDNKEEYNIIYNKLIKDGIAADTIRKGMESRQKKDEGVTKVDELKQQRYLAPEQEAQFNSKLKPVKQSSAWKKADSEQRKYAEGLLYEIVAMTGSYKDYKRVIEGGSGIGITEEEWLQYKLGLRVVDQENDSRKYGTYTSEEKDAALDLIPGLEREERDYLKNPSEYLEKKK